MMWTTLPVAIGLGLLALSPRFEPPHRLTKTVNPAPPRFPLAIRPDPVVLGVVHPGKPAGMPLSIRNMQTAPLTLERIETSCFCVDVGGAPVRLEPDEAGELEVTFDPADDPDFEGRLAVEVTGYLDDGTIGFQTRVKVEMAAEGQTLRD